ncbi:GDSL-type esterase/lipase family protein [Kitasatospora purpeofusca]|uniref:GDSL-type esterase/lipase family protein n=1 Tax=Kitasatospora purpeofusca TaxID=67352 RepID=UPI0037FD73E2
MTIALRAGSTVRFTGDSITDGARLASEDGLGFGYPLRIAGEWGLRHPDRPVTWPNTGIAGHKVIGPEARRRTDVLDARTDVVSVLVGANDMGWQTTAPDGRPFPAAEFAAGYNRLLAPPAAAGTRLILVEPSLLAVGGTFRAGHAVVDDQVRKLRRADPDPKVEAVHEPPAPTARGCWPRTTCSPGSRHGPGPSTGLSTACTRRRPCRPRLGLAAPGPVSSGAARRRRGGQAPGRIGRGGCRTGYSWAVSRTDGRAPASATAPATASSDSNRSTA